MENENLNSNIDMAEQISFSIPDLDRIHEMAFQNIHLKRDEKLKVVVALKMLSLAQRIRKLVMQLGRNCGPQLLHKATEACDERREFLFQRN